MDKEELTTKRRGAVIAVFAVVIIGVSGAIVPCIQTLEHKGVTAAFPLYVIVGSAVFLSMLMGFFLHRWSR